MYKMYIFSHVLQHRTAPHRTTGCLVRAIQNISPAALVICGYTKGFLYYIRGRFFLYAFAGLSLLIVGLEASEARTSSGLSVAHKVSNGPSSTPLWFDTLTMSRI